MAQFTLGDRYALPGMKRFADPSLTEDQPFMGVNVPYDAQQAQDDFMINPPSAPPPMATPPAQPMPANTGPAGQLAQAPPPAPSGKPSAYDRMKDLGPPPAPPKENAFQTVGRALLTPRFGADAASAMIHPRYTSQLGGYQQQQGYLSGQLKAEQAEEQTQGLKDQREATAEQKKAQAESYADRDAQKTAALAEKEADSKRKAFAKVVGKQTPVYAPKDAPVPPNMTALQDPDVPDKVALVPNPLQAAPKELVEGGYLPGSKAGDAVPVTQLQPAYEAYYKDKRETLKQDAKVDKGPANETQLALKAAQGDPDSLKALAILAKQKAAERPLAPTINIDPAALSKAAEQYNATGVLPSVGFGKEAALMRAKIMNEAARTDPNANLSLNKAEFDSMKSARGKVQGQKSQIMAFENTASRNLDLAVQMSDQVDRTGSPLINKALLALKGQVIGDTDALKLKNSVVTAASEYAKVISGATSGVLTDSARKEAEQMLTDAMSKGTFKEVTALMKREMMNRRSGFDQSLSELDSAMSKGKVAPSNAQPAAPQPQAAGIQVTDPKGGVHTFKTQAQADTFKRLAGIQ